MTSCKPRVVPVRVRTFSPELTVDVSRVVAYRGVCSCGWRSEAQPTVREARQLLRVHQPGSGVGAGRAGGT